MQKEKEDTSRPDGTFSHSILALFNTKGFRWSIYIYWPIQSCTQTVAIRTSIDQFIYASPWILCEIKRSHHLCLGWKKQYSSRCGPAIGIPVYSVSYPHLSIWILLCQIDKINPSLFQTNSVIKSSRSCKLPHSLISIPFNSRFTSHDIRTFHYWHIRLFSIHNFPCSVGWLYTKKIALNNLATDSALRHSQYSDRNFPFRDFSPFYNVSNSYSDIIVNGLA